MVEPGIDGAVAARARGVDPVICARLEDVGLAAGSVAAAGMFDVLEHIEDEAGALQQVHALLRPGGLLFLTVPAYALLHSVDDIGLFAVEGVGGPARRCRGKGRGLLKMKVPTRLIRKTSTCLTLPLGAASPALT